MSIDNEEKKIGSGKAGPGRPKGLKEGMKDAYKNKKLMEARKLNEEIIALRIRGGKSLTEAVEGIDMKSGALPEPAEDVISTGIINSLQFYKSATRNRPSVMLTPKELEKAIRIYFEQTEINSITLHGLLLFLGITKTQLPQYQQSSKHSIIIEKGIMLVSQAAEERLAKKSRIGDIFILKNVAGWADKAEIDQTSKGEKIIADNISDDQAKRILERLSGKKSGASK